MNVRYVTDAAVFLQQAAHLLRAHLGSCRLTRPVQPAHARPLPQHQERQQRAAQAAERQRQAAERQRAAAKRQQPAAVIMADDKRK